MKRLLVARPTRALLPGNVRRRVTLRRAVCGVAAVCLAGAGLVGLAASPAAAATTSVVVGNGDIAPNGTWALEPTSNTGTYSFVNGPGSPPGGVGSLAMSIASGQHEWLNNYANGYCATGPSCSTYATSTLLSTIDTLGYSTYRTSGTTFPTYNIEVDPVGDGSGYTTLIFEPSKPIVNNTWQTWDGLNPSDGAWVSSQTVTNPPTSPFNCAPQSCSASWSQIQTGFPSGRIKYGFGPNLGTGGTFTGNVDNLTMGISGTTTVFNFEPDCTTDCYVNAGTGNDLNTGQSGDPLKTIQAGVNRVSSGGTVHVAAGTYVENVTVPKGIDITGAGNTTIVEPAVSNPNCGGGGGSSLCSGGSNVFLIQANNVTIDHLKIDGDNPSLPTGVNAGGANIDARNGIIEDFNTAPCSGGCNNTSVHDVTVNNIYLRGIYASSGGSGFNFSNNTVNNVQADPGSVAIFNFGGSGTISGNHVSNASDAIAANWSAGTMFTGNTITSSGSGVHTDNSGGFGGGVPDVLSGNNVSSCTAGGYGVWAFVPYNPPSIANNTVSGCGGAALAAVGSCNLTGTNNCPGGTVPTVSFSNNNVTTVSGGLGLQITTNVESFYPTGGDGDVHVSGDHNTFTGPGTGVYVEEDQTYNPAGVVVHVNRSAVNKAQNTGSIQVDASCNWWGQSSGPAVGQVTGSILTSQWLTNSNLDSSCGSVGGGGGGGGGATVPGPPRSVFAVPGNAKATVSWAAPASNGGSAITGYIVTPIKAGSPQTPHVFNSTNTKQTISGLTNGASYKFQIAARNAIGTSATSTSTGAITVGAPGAPPKPTVSNGAAGSVKVKFSAPSGNGAPITKFTATCNSSNGGAAGSKSGKNNPITVSGLTAGAKYTCRVSATNSRGTGPRSAPSASIVA
jgi:hypothetical protein